VHVRARVPESPGRRTSAAPFPAVTEKIRETILLGPGRLPAGPSPELRQSASSGAPLLAVAPESHHVMARAIPVAARASRPPGNCHAPPRKRQNLQVGNPLGARPRIRPAAPCRPAPRTGLPPGSSPRPRAQACGNYCGRPRLVHGVSALSSFAISIRRGPRPWPAAGPGEAWLESLPRGHRPGFPLGQVPGSAYYFPSRVGACRHQQPGAQGSPRCSRSCPPASCPPSFSDPKHAIFFRENCPSWDFLSPGAFLTRGFTTVSLF